MLRQKICGRFVGKGDICCGCSPGQLTKSRRGKAALAVVPVGYALLHVRKAYATPCFHATHVVGIQVCAIRSARVQSKIQLIKSKEHLR